MRYKLKKDLKAGDIINTNLGEDICEEVKEVEVNRFLYEKPRVLERYWTIMYSHNKDIHNMMYGNSGNHYNNFETGNCYSSSALAKKARDKQLANMELLRTNKGFVPDWSDHDQKKWFIEYNHKEDRPVASYVDDYQCIDVYFEHRGHAENAIDTLGEDKIKLALGVD